MILMQQPSVVFHAHDVDADYKMLYTINLHEGATANYVAARITELHQRTPLKNIIFNAHGHGAKVSIAGKGLPGLEPSSVGAFGVLKSLNIGTIWLTSCSPAMGTDGKTFCQSLADTAGTQVIGSDWLQEIGLVDGFRLASPTFVDGQIDEFEGAVYSFTPTGKMRPIVDPNTSPFIWTIKT